jgi:hypothetical protein
VQYLRMSFKKENSKEKSQKESQEKITALKYVKNIKQDARNKEMVDKNPFLSI